MSSGSLEIKRAKTSYFDRVLVRSKDRENLSTTTSDNFTVRYKEPIEGKHRVAWTSIPNTLYNITSSNNLIYADGATPQTEPMTPGNYDGTTLAAEVQRVLQAAPISSTATVTFDATTSKLEIGTAGVVFDDTTDASTTPNSANATIGAALAGETIAINGQLANSVFLANPLSLGIRIEEATDYGYVTGGGSFSTRPSLNVRQPIPPGATPSTMAAQDVYESSTEQGTIVVPLTSDYGVLDFKDFEKNPQYVSIESASKVLHIRVVDSGDGSQVDFNGADWEMYLEKIESYSQKRKRRKIRHQAPEDMV